MAFDAADDIFCEDLDYEIELVKLGREIKRGQESRLRALRYGRLLDGVSTASVEIFVPSPDCAGGLGLVDYDNTTLTIHNGGNESWHGRVNKVRYRSDSVIVEAEDLLSWLNRRLLRVDLTFVNAPIEEIALAIYNNCVMSIDPPEAILRTYLSGLTESREMQASQNRYGWSIMSEMLDTGLDVTTFGRQVLFGLPQFGKPIQMTDDDIISPDGSPVELVKDGDDAGNFVVVDAQNDTAATYPDVRQRTNGYPVVDVVVNDGQITDEQSAKNAARARYEWSAQGVRRVNAEGGLALSPYSKIDPHTLICGQPITFAANNVCYSASETLRLGSLDVAVSAGVQSSTIELQPLGSFETVGNA